MTKDCTHVAIAGAGIGGLTAALSLHAKGIDATVLERTPELRALGVGINLLPHAVRELHRLGVGDALAELAVAPHSIHYYSTDGDLLFQEPRGVHGGYGHPQLSVHRGELQMILLTAVLERLGSDAVRTGNAVQGFDDDGGGVTVELDGGPARFDALVGADGISSTVRALLHPHGDPLLWSGTRMLRGAARMTPFLDGRTMVIVKGDNGIELVAYPIGADLVNWVLMVPGGTAGPLRRDTEWNSVVGPVEPLELMRDWTLGWLDVGELVATTATVFEYPMVDRDILPHWGVGRVTLLGDAAHPMYPVGANGGSQAIVDARVLADHLALRGTAGLRAYEDERRPETGDVIAANRAMHFATHRSPADLARITDTYRTDTARSSRS